MQTESRILIQAPADLIFETAGDLRRWPAILPHYREVVCLEEDGDRMVVCMACHRNGIPVAWLAERTLDRAARIVRFRHLAAWTKGMIVEWLFDERPEGTLVRITHALKFRFPPLAPIAERIIGGFFIEAVAHRTLTTMKRHLEARTLA